MCPCIEATRAMSASGTGRNVRTVTTGEAATIDLSMRRRSRVPTEADSIGVRARLLASTVGQTMPGQTAAIVVGRTNGANGVTGGAREPTGRLRPPRL